MEKERIIEGNKLIAEFMGYTHKYTCNISRGGGVMKNVDLLSKIKFMSLQELRDSDENIEGAPFFEGYIAIGKYGGHIFYNNVVLFSTDSLTVPVTISYNERFQAYHSSWDWLMPVLEKIEAIDEDGTHYNVVIGFKTYCGISESKGMLGNAQRWESSHTVNEPGKIYTWKPETKIEAVWIAVVKFLEYYNNK